MSLLDIISKNKEPQVDSSKLTIQDIEYLLSLLKTVTLRGDQVELFYNLVVKLQNQYVLLTKNS